VARFNLNVKSVKISRHIVNIMILANTARKYSSQTGKCKAMVLDVYSDMSAVIGIGQY